MSDAARKCVDACTHPLVKGAALALLRAIADIIPAGQTTTPSIAIDELAALARQHESTARRRRDLLVAIKEIKVHDGGQGSKARYELVHLSGERPIVEAPLPLVGAAAPKRARGRRPAIDVITPSLFEEPIAPVSEERAKNIGLFARCWGSKHRAFCAMLGSYFGLFARCWRNIALFARSSAPPLDGTRAGAVLPLKEVLLPPAAAAPPTRPPPDPNPLRCRWFPKPHAWCVGRAHMPTPLDEDFRRKLGFLPGETAREQQLRAWEIYASEAAKIPADQPIAGNDFDHWRPILAAYLARAAPIRTAPNARAAPSLELHARARAERQQRQGSGYS